MLHRRGLPYAFRLFTPLLFFEILVHLQINILYTTDNEQLLSVSPEIHILQHHVPVVPPKRLKIIVLTTKDPPPLEQLVRSLRRTDYRGDTVDLMICLDKPMRPYIDRNVQIDELWSKLTWDAGELFLSTAQEGSRQLWVDAWRPASSSERAIIFYDSDVELLPPQWYECWKEMYRLYGHRVDIAGFRWLHRSQSSVSTRADSMIAFAPLASTWIDFLEFIDCALGSNSLFDDSVVDHANDLDAKQTSIGMRLFSRYLEYYNLKTVNVVPRDSTPQTLRLLGKMGEADFVLQGLNVQISATPSTSTLQTMVIAAAVGYTFKEFKRFLISLRAHYDGEVALLIWKNTSADIFDLLTEYGVRIVTTHERGGPRLSAGWSRVNSLRWKFYEDNCQEGLHDLCMAVDFRDSLFQDDPFRHMKAGRPGEPILHLFEHNTIFNDWHTERAAKCVPGSEALVRYKKMINAGELLGAPAAFSALAKLITQAGDCDDQDVLNLGVYGKSLKASITVHPQGRGNVNNVGYGGEFRRDSRGRFLNRNCFPSPVVHQFDRVER